MSPPDPSFTTIEKLLREARQARSQALGAALSRLFAAPARMWRKAAPARRAEAAGQSPLTPPARN